MHIHSKINIPIHPEINMHIHPGINMHIHSGINIPIHPEINMHIHPGTITQNAQTPIPLIVLITIKPYPCLCVFYKS